MLVLKENKQVIRSREWIFNALVILMKKKEFKDIKIGEITEKAGVARLTFYRNYESKEDIILKKGNDIYNDIILELKKISSEDNAVYKSIYKIVTIFDEYANLFSLLLKNRLDYLILQSFESKISNIFNTISNLNSSNKYLVKFYEGALFSIAVEWVKNSRKETVGEMTDIIFSIISEKGLVVV